MPLVTDKPLNEVIFVTLNITLRINKITMTLPIELIIDNGSKLFEFFAKRSINVYKPKYRLINTT